MRIAWKVKDDKAPAKTHYLDVDDDELAACQTTESRLDLIEDTVQEAFERQVSYVWEVVTGQRGG